MPTVVKLRTFSLKSITVPLTLRLPLSSLFSRSSWPCGLAGLFKETAGLREAAQSAARRHAAIDCGYPSILPTRPIDQPSIAERSLTDAERPYLFVFRSQTIFLRPAWA